MKGRAFGRLTCCLLSALTGMVCAGDPVNGTYTGSGGSDTSPLGWTSTGSYNRLQMSPWLDGYVAQNGGVVMLTKAVWLKPPTGLSLDGIKVANAVGTGFSGCGFTLSGETPFITAVDKGSFSVAASTPVSGTGVLSVKTSPVALAFDYGYATFVFKSVLSGFSRIDLGSGYVYDAMSGTDQTCVTLGNVRLSNARFFYQGLDTGANSASMATGSGASLTFAPGSSVLRVQKYKGTSATLTVGPIVRESRAAAQLGGGGATVGTLGVSEFLKTTGSTASYTHNGFIDPWLIVYGENDNLNNGDFAVYDDEKGFIPATALYTDNTLATTEAKPIASLSGNMTISASASVKGLRLVNTNTTSSGSIKFENDAVLSVGDGTNPAAMILNYSNKSGTGMYLSGSGAIDFGSSEGLVWCCVRDDDARRYLYVNVPIKGQNGLTFASPAPNNTRRAPIVQLSAVPDVTGDMHLRGVRLTLSDAKYAPFPAIYVDGGTVCRSAQLFLSTANMTITNRLYISGNGLMYQSDLAGAINVSSGATFTGPVTLTGDATLAGTATYAGAIGGTGTLVVQANNKASTVTFKAANSYVGETVVQQLTYDGANYPITFNLTDSGTFGTGTVRILTNATVNVKRSCTLANDITGEGTLAIVATPSTSSSDVTYYDVTLNGAVDVRNARVETGNTLRVKNLTAALATGGGTIAAADSDSTVVIDTDEDVLSSVLFTDGGSGKLKLVKRGKGKLSLMPGQTFTGGLVIEGGTVETVRSISTPLDDGRLFWLDATQTDTMTLDGDSVTKWFDASGNGFFFGGYSGFASPTLVADGINGKKSVRFVSNRLLGSAAATFRTLFFVVKTKEFVTSAGLFGHGARDRNGIREVNYDISGVETWSKSYNYAHFVSTGGYTINGVANQYLIDYQNPQILVAERRDSNTFNNEKVLSFTPALGGYYLGTDRNYNGDIAEVVAYDRILSDAERHLIEDYLAAKWENTDFYEDQALAADCAVTLDGSSTLDLAGATNVTVKAVNGQGTITSSSDAVLTITDGSGLAANITGPIAVTAGGATAAERVTLSDGATLAVTGGSHTLSAYNYALPTDGLVCWMDASDAATITTNDAGEVTTWSSKAGSLSFAADGTLPKPTYLPADAAGSLDGNKPAVYFSGSGRMRLKSSGSLSAATTFVVWQAKGSQTSCYGVLGYLNADCGLRYWSTGGLQYCYECSPFTPYDICTGNGERLSDAGNGATAASVFPADETHVLAGVAADGRSLYTCSYALGSYHGSAERCFTGWLCEVIVYNRCLSEAERKGVEAYLMDKWQRDGELPGAATALGGAVSVAAGASATVPNGTVVSGAGTVTGDITLPSPYVVTTTSANSVPCLTVNGTVTIPSDTALYLDAATRLKGTYPFISATAISGTFGSFSSSLTRHAYEIRGNKAYVGKRSTGLFVIAR